MSALASLGARQSPRGESEPPEPTFGALGNAERLNWLRIEKSQEEDFKPFADGREVVLMAALRRQQVWPVAPLAIAPGIVGKKRYPAWKKSEAAQIVQVEVLQLVWADFLLGKLTGASSRRYKSSGDICVSTMASSSREVSAPNRSVRAAQRIKY